MEGKPSRAPAAPATERVASAVGGFVDLEGETVYRIAAFHRLDPFLMTLPAPADLWMFVASGGGLTAGRVDADGSLFPYLTVDQLHDAHHHTGPLTLMRVETASGERVLYEPLAAASVERPGVERNLYKNTTGNRLVFEEIDRELGIAFGYRWSGCDAFGWVRTATLRNLRETPVRISLLDGLRNVLPYGAPLSLYQQASVLVDAYKKTEVDVGTGLGIFSLTSRITDRAEALEVLRANTVWCCGLERFEVHLSLEAVAAFRAGTPLPPRLVGNGVRGNYLLSADLVLGPGEAARWHLVADAGQDHARIAQLRRRIAADADLPAQIEANLREAEDELRRGVASADGLQLTGHAASWCHHFANVLFNNMRGGVFMSNDLAPAADFVAWLRVRNRQVAERQQATLAALSSTSTVEEIRRLARGSGDVEYERLCFEYLPLFFGRRHGDPSRPWNRFSIRARNRHGERELGYEGNWRDIFQNWEALGHAFVGFLPSFVAKFVNASTVDGFNPYRVTRDGVEWETPSPGDPWSNIGYWGDHQIVYLLRLLEAMDHHDPTAIGALLGREIFSYAEVPYRIESYEAILEDPGRTIVYDHDLARHIGERVERLGTDGKLLQDEKGSIYHASLLEKLIVPALSKLSNLVPDAGIWMNTQRPEWNDANNALAAGGVSVVTLCHLRRYLAFVVDRLTPLADRTARVSTEVVDWFDRIESILREERDTLTPRLEAARRKRLMDRLGDAFSTYRQTVYTHGFTGKTDLAVRRVVGLGRTALTFLDASIAANRRPDGLFHTYNLLAFGPDDGVVEISQLQEMLEGQVAVLGSGFLDPAQALAVLQALFGSALYQPRQRSFLLYPEHDPPGFLARNVVPTTRVEAIGLLRDLLAAEDPSILVRDADGVCRFQGDLRNAEDLDAALTRLGADGRWADAVARDRTSILELFEAVFHHRSYTGRSKVMYAYEGVGCIYWHMVAKLLLAVQEHVLWARRDSLPVALQHDLARTYFRIRAGIGYEKTVAEFGAFPTDPYSHTPARGGAKQPGMTGQVKEEILTRRGELGIDVEGGRVRFAPVLLQPRELLGQSARFHYFDVGGRARSLALPPKSLAFTLCQVPVVYEQVDADAWIRVTFTDGSSTRLDGDRLDAGLSRSLFARDGRIDHLRVGIPERDLCRLE